VDNIILLWGAMKKNKLPMLVLLLLLAAHILPAQTITVATFNLRYDNPRDSGNLWKDRAPVVANLIRFHGFDIFGTQEGLKNQLDDIANALPAYAWYGVGRDDGKDKGEFAAIFYRKDKFRVLKSGDFWLSPTPEKPGPGWDARLNRICSWLQLEDLKTKKKFFFFNTHFDHQGMEARRQSAKLILEKMKTLAGNNPVILTGDFNGDHTSEWYQALANSNQVTDTYKLAANPYVNNGSFNNFGHNLQHNSIIDHIFITKPLKVEKWGVLTDSYHGKYPSDHFPVMTVLSWK
jgi:endonuclease/exonuclease/phosphatase family metal-dependent hydrolase